MDEFVKRLKHTFGSQLRYVGTTTTTDKDSGDVDVLVQLEQLTDIHIRHAWDVINRVRSNWNLVLDCRIRSAKDLQNLPVLERYLLKKFLNDYFGENPFRSYVPTQPELEGACQRRIEQQEQRILSLLPRVVFDPAQLREIGQAVFDAARALLVVSQKPEINKREVCAAVTAITPAFDDITRIYEGYLNTAAVINVPAFIADALTLVKHMAYRAKAVPVTESVLLVNIPATVMPHPLDDVVGFDANMPLGLVCIASFLQQHHIPVEILDAYAHNLSASGVIDEIAKGKGLPRIVGLNSASPNINVVFALAKYLKRINKDIRVVCGGSHATLAPAHTLAFPHVDAVVAGEGEQPFLEFCRQVLHARKTGPFLIPGIYERDGTGVLQGIPNPNDFPMAQLARPRFDLLPLEEVYFRKRKRLYLHTTRGCRFRCIYCSVHNFWGGTVKAIPMDVLFDHLTFLLERFKPDEVQIVDDNFSDRHGARITEFCQQVKERQLAFKWKCQVRADQVTPEHVRLMGEAGCFEVDVGIESGNLEMQHRIKKGLKLDQARSLVSALCFNKMVSKAFFMLGFPDESDTQLGDTINFAVELKSLGLSDVAFFPTMPFPGTQLAEVVRKLCGREVLQGAVMDDTIIRDHSFANHRLRKYSARPEVSVNSNYTPQELRYLAKFAYERFESGKRVADLREEFRGYVEQEEELVYGAQ